MTPEQLERLLARFEPRLRRQVQRALDRLVRGFHLTERDLALRGAALLQIERALRTLPIHLRPAIRTLAEVMGRVAVGSTRTPFTAIDPTVLWAAEQQGTQLFAGLTRTTSRAINRVIIESVSGRLTPAQAIAKIRDLVGSRARAKMIALTELRKAAAAGQQIGLELDLASGRLKADELQRVWRTDPLERNVCPICGPMDGQVRGILEPFTGGDGQAYLTFPVHPHCRCAIFTRANPAFGRRPQAA